MIDIVEGAMKDAATPVTNRAMMSIQPRPLAWWHRADDGERFVDTLKDASSEVGERGDRIR